MASATAPAVLCVVMDNQECGAGFPAHAIAVSDKGAHVVWRIFIATGEATAKRIDYYEREACFAACRCILQLRYE